MRSRLSDKARLQHIVDAITEIENYLAGADINSFLGNSMMKFACIKQLEIIGEACKHITQETRVSNPQIQWKQISGLRDIFVHEYFGVDPQIVWEILVSDIPRLKEDIKQLI